MRATADKIHIFTYVQVHPPGKEYRWWLHFSELVVNVIKKKKLKIGRGSGVMHGFR